MSWNDAMEKCHGTMPWYHVMEKCKNGMEKCYGTRHGQMRWKSVMETCNGALLLLLLYIQNLIHRYSYMYTI